MKVYGVLTLSCYPNTNWEWPKLGNIIDISSEWAESQGITKRQLGNQKGVTRMMGMIGEEMEKENDR